MNHYLVDLPFCTKGKKIKILCPILKKKKLVELRGYSSGGKALACGHKDMSLTTRTHIKSSECSGWYVVVITALGR